MPRELAQIMREAFPRLSEIAQQVGGKDLTVRLWNSRMNSIRSRKTVFNRYFRRRERKDGTDALRNESNFEPS